MNPLARPYFNVCWVWLAMLLSGLGGAIPALGQVTRPATADSLRLLREAEHPPVLPPVVVPTDTLVQIGMCPNAGSRARIFAILFFGNTKTKERILRAELNLREGDTLALTDLPARLEANRRRLYNLQIFHAVLVQATCGGSGQITLVFSVQERWYVIPTPILSIADPNLKRWLDRPGSERWQRLDYGVHLTHTNFRGRAEQLVANLQLGFNRKYELFYEVPGFGRRRRVGMGFGISYYQSRNLDYTTDYDRPKPLPQPEEDAFPIQRFYVSGGLRLRHTVQFITALDVAYHRERISDSIYHLNPDYFLGRTQREYVEFSLVSTNNQRNTFAYPLTGRFMQAAVVFRQFVGGPAAAPSYATVRLRYAQYVSLGKQFYYALGLWGQTRLLAQRYAYADSRALGYEALVRGYDAFIIDGRSYGLVQQGLSYRAWAPPPLRLPFIASSKVNTLPLALYLNIFADAGLASGNLGRPEPATNQLPGQLLASVGLGLHVVTYYDRVFCLEIARTAHHQTGFFIRSAFPI